VISVSSITRNNPDHPELAFARSYGIRITERDAGLSEILNQKNLKMIAAAGTHGKTTTTAMIIWTLQQLGIPISYSVGAKTNFADMGHYEPDSEYFAYECDEFHRNFLHFYPHFSVISGVTWDHHEVYPTREDYKRAFRDFISQSKNTVLWQTDADYLSLDILPSVTIIDDERASLDNIALAGLYNRRNAWLVAETVHQITSAPRTELYEILSKFPGSQRRMEEIIPNLFSDYAHTPEKIIGCLSAAQELASLRQKKIVVVYEPLTNRRQHFMKNDYKNCFAGVEHVYWVPSYLSRENPEQPVLSPEQLIGYLDDPTIAEPASMNDQLWQIIKDQLERDRMVVCMSGGGGKSLDEWLRAKAQELSPSTQPH
jgi:UDP-N-acetylmuramate--alanine ligase